MRSMLASIRVRSLAEDATGKSSHHAAYLLHITEPLRRSALSCSYLAFPPARKPPPTSSLSSYPIQVLKLHEMNVEIERPKLLAARRLGKAFKQRQLSVSTAAAPSEWEGTSDYPGAAKLPRSETSSGMTNLSKASPEGEGGEMPPKSGIVDEGSPWPCRIKPVWNATE